MAKKNVSLDVKPRDFTDVGNSEVFIRVFKPYLIFVDSLGPFRHEGHRWISDIHADVDAATWLSGKMLDDALTEYAAAAAALTDAEVAYSVDKSDPNKDKLLEAKSAKAAAAAYKKHAETLRSGNHIKNMIAFSIPQMTVDADALDKDPFALCCPDGIIDLHTGKYRHERDDDYCTKCTDIEPDKADSDLWLEHLSKVMCGDPSLINYFQVMIGSCIVGKAFEETMFTLYNDTQNGDSNGSNGKSTTMNAISSTLGGYAGAVSVDLFTTGGNMNRGANMAELVGKRLVITSELEEGRRLSVSTLKRLCSTDAVVVERKYMRPETVIPTWHIVMLTNHLARIGSTDNGTWRRMKIFPFNAVLSHDDAIPNYGAELIEKCGSAILQWAIDGAVKFTRNGCKLPDMPDKVAASTDAYRQRENWIANFINECCEIGDKYSVRSSELYSTYRDWAQHTGDFVRRQTEFNDAMVDLKFKRIRPKNVATWRGIRISNRQYYYTRDEAALG